MDGIGDLNAQAALSVLTEGSSGAADLRWPAPFAVIEPLRRTTPLVFASPHSGQHYPAAFLTQSRLPLLSLRRSEDAYVDELFAAAASFGAPILTATLARAFIDVNRDPAELDPDMFAERLPMHVQRGSPRVQAGLGAIPRIAADGQDIYRRKLGVAEARERLSQVHSPYHGMLSALISEARAAFGCAVLIDCHSMPSCARGPLQPDIVLGDRFGASCHPSVTGFVEAALQRMGYKVTRNTPFAGGHTTQSHGRPALGVHVLQVEINRSLYMDERTLARTGGFERVRADMTRLVAALATAQWERTLR
jgi:N-formylglutamate amidohydrolase